MLSLASVAASVGLLSLVTGVQAGFNPASSKNVVVYWGQNSAGTGTSQQRLSFYCQNADVDVILMSFLVGINTPNLNLANIGDRCSPIPGTNLMRCPEVEADIMECQQTWGKTIMLSLGGATYTEGGFSSDAAATAAANNLWALFGPVQSGSSVNRPFGQAVIDGWDFDFESTFNNGAPFVRQLRQLADNAGGKKYYLSAAPQCPYPDEADKGFLTGQVAMDFLNVQFYNNFCGAGHFPSNWNFPTWDNWAKTVSANPNAKVLVGLPAAPGGAGAGSYVSGSQLANVIADAKRFSSFGGVMLWDMSQLWQNTGFLDEVINDLGGSAAPPPSNPPPPPPSNTPPPSNPPPSGGGGGGGVEEWGQCGGIGYTGPTQCAAGLRCVATGAWWSSCIH